MEIFGHEDIDYEQCYKVENSNEIQKTPANSLLKIEDFDLDLLKFCQANKLRYMVNVANIKEAIFANIFNATYIRANKSLAKELMPIAQNYLFDSKVIAVIDDEKEIVEMAKANIDGVWFR